MISSFQLFFFSVFLGDPSFERVGCHMLCIRRQECFGVSSDVRSCWNEKPYRAVILPELWCLCARFWWIASDCILVGQDNHVGAAYNCPLDHNIMPGRLLQDKDGTNKGTKTSLLDFREPRFLNHASRMLESSGDGAASSLKATRLVKSGSDAKEGGTFSHVCRPCIEIYGHVCTWDGVPISW